jgi:hypothetical protein
VARPRSLPAGLGRAVEECRLTSFDARGPARKNCPDPRRPAKCRTFLDQGPGFRTSGRLEVSILVPAQPHWRYATAERTPGVNANEQGPVVGLPDQCPERP